MAEEQQTVSFTIKPFKISVQDSNNAVTVTAYNDTTMEEYKGVFTLEQLRGETDHVIKTGGILCKFLESAVDTSVSEATLCLEQQGSSLVFKCSLKQTLGTESFTLTLTRVSVDQRELIKRLSSRVSKLEKALREKDNEKYAWLIIFESLHTGNSNNNYTVCIRISPTNGAISNTSYFTGYSHLGIPSSTVDVKAQIFKCPACTLPLRNNYCRQFGVAGYLVTARVFRVLTD
mmetsp:Transcript_19681/g.21897  ORF Transcript_19681/g.21897 Transcript_19681/m.21897 type:complete len:232 (+) Transcript_19681:30-725(+)